MRGITLLYTLLACSTAILSDVNVCPDTENDEPLRHEDCNKFYICKFSRPIEYRCYGDLLFNLETLQCDSPRNVDCKGRYIPHADDVVSTDSTALESSAAASIEQKTVSRKKRFLPNGCPDTNIHWLLPHETNCSLFYYCVWGDLVVKECPPGTHFNKALQVCDWPQNAKCSSYLQTNLYPTTPSITTTTPMTLESTTNQTTAETTSEPSNPETTIYRKLQLTTPKIEFLLNGCPVNPHIHWLLPHETDCNMFYYCVWGDLVLRQCPQDTHFNSVLQVCDWPQHTNCSAGPTTNSTPATSEPTTTESATRDPTKPDPTTPEPTTPGPTSELTTLIPSTPEPTTPESATPEPTTPGPTTPDPITPEPTTSEPTTPKITTPKPTTSKPTKPEFLPNGCPVNPHIHWLLPHETDCTMFYYCVWGDLVLRQCPRGTHFNSVLQVCDWPQNANCSAGLTTVSTLSTPGPITTESATRDPAKPDPITPEPTTPGSTSGPTTLIPSTLEPTTPESETPEPTTPGPTTRDPITPEHTTPEPTAPKTTTPKPTTPMPTKPEFLPNGCPVNPHIHWLLPHETDCTMFYYCVWGDLVLRQCPRGTHFNSVLQVCDWPQNANCSAGLTTVSTPSTPGPITTESATRDPAKPDPITPEPTTLGSTSGPTTLIPSTLEPTTPESETSEPTTPGPTTRDPKTPEHTTPEPTAPKTTTLKPTTPMPTKPEFLPNGCPVNPHIHWLLPHETDCTMFYYCVWGDLVLRQCPRGTHFNNVLQVCDWPQNANCSAGLTTVSTPSTPGPITTESATRDPAKPDPITPEPTTPGSTSGPTTLIPSTLEPTTPESETPEPTTPGPTTRDPKTPEHTTPEPTAPKTTTPKPTTPMPTKPEFLPNGCPVNPHIHWLLPHETDCTMFYYCVWGDLVLRQCPRGTQFNSVLQVCDWPPNANCSAGLTTVSTPSTPGPITTESATRDPVKPDPITPEPTTPGSTSGPTTQIPSTLEPTTPESATPEPTTSGPTTLDPIIPEPTTPEPTTSKTTTPKPTTSKPTKPEFLPNGCPVNPHTHWLLPHETDCTMFYYCVWGDLNLRQCAPGTQFNRILQVCDWPQDAGCTPTLNKHVIARRALLSL